MHVLEFKRNHLTGESRLEIFFPEDPGYINRVKVNLRTYNVIHDKSICIEKGNGYLMQLELEDIGVVDSKIDLYVRGVLERPLET